LGALRVLERVERQRRPALPMPDGWHPMPGSAWEALDVGDELAVRKRWFCQIG
jgi:hypothetical protein